MVLPRWRGLNSSKFCKNSVDFSSVTDIIKAMHYLSCLKSLPGSYFFSLSPATATNFDSWSVVFSNIRKVVTVPPTMSRKFDGLEVGCIVFCAKFIFLFLLLLLPLLPIAFHWSLQKKLIPGFVRSSVLFYPIFLQYRSILIKLASLTLATAFSRQIRRRLVGVFAPNSVYVPSTSRFSLKRSFRQYVWLPLNNAWFAHSMLPCVCLLVILRDDLKMWLKQKSSRVCHWCFYPILTTSAIFYRQMATWNMFFFFIYHQKWKAKCR